MEVGTGLVIAGTVNALAMIGRAAFKALRGDEFYEAVARKAEAEARIVEAQARIEEARRRPPQVGPGPQVS